MVSQFSYNILYDDPLLLSTQAADISKRQEASFSQVQWDRAFNRICLCVCLFVCTVKGKWLELSAPKSVDI